MLYRDLANVLHKERLQEAHESRRYRAAAHERSQERRQARADARARRRKLRSLRREAHRATVGAFVAFGDGVSDPSANRRAHPSSRTEVRTGGRR